MEWNYLLAILGAFGFSQHFQQPVFQCMSTVSYTLLLYGSQEVSLNPSKILRQGDPL